MKRIELAKMMIFHFIVMLIITISTSSGIGVALLTINILSVIWFGIWAIILLATYSDFDVNVSSGLFSRLMYINPKEHEGILWKKYDEIVEDTMAKSGEKSNFKSRVVKFSIFYVFLFLGLSILGKYDSAVVLYNTSKKYCNEYQKKTDERKGFYDKLWKTYLTKEKICDVNRETFIYTTKIIMENLQDGQNVAWKWTSRNVPNIPYETFSSFYADLSNFIIEQREGYFNIEKQCMEIAQKNNTMLDTFPNNFYNKVLDLPRINFEYGITSDSTENVFESKRENLGVANS